MTDQPAFAVDIKHNDPLGGEWMLHVRADDWETFAARLAEAGRAFPFARTTYARDAEPPALLRQAREAAARTAGHPRQGEEPTCPEHGGGKPSLRHGGFYCPARNDDDTYCRWTSKKARSA